MVLILKLKKTNGLIEIVIKKTSRFNYYLLKNTLTKNPGIESTPALLLFHVIFIIKTKLAIYKIPTNC